MQLHLLLLQLCVERFELLFRGFVIGLRLIEILFGHDARVEQLLRAVELLLGVGDVCDLRRARGCLTSHRGFLLQRINLNQRLTGGHAIARLHEDLRDLAFDLRIDSRRMSRFERREILGRVRNGDVLRDDSS